MSWNELDILCREDFIYPDKLSLSVVYGLDMLSQRADVRPIILSDYRPGDSGQHGRGLAIDFYVPGVDPVKVLDVIRAMKYFHGYGMYLNEKNVVSFHVDMRADRTAADPATWGAFINPDEAGDRVYDYVALSSVLESVKNIFGSSGGASAIILLLALGFVLSCMRS